MARRILLGALMCVPHLTIAGAADGPYPKATLTRELWLSQSADGTFIEGVRLIGRGFETFSPQTCVAELDQVDEGIPVQLSKNGRQYFFNGERMIGITPEPTASEADTVEDQSQATPDSHNIIISQPRTVTPKLSNEPGILDKTQSFRFSVGSTF